MNRERIIRFVIPAIVGIIILVSIIVLLGLASGNPDGLEKVASDLGFLGSGLDAPYQILPDYTIPFLGDTALSTIMAGVVGATVLIGLLVLLGRNLRRQKSG